MNIKVFVSSLPFIVSFLILTLLIQTFAGGKILFYFLVLVFASMVILNADKLQAITTKYLK